MKILLLDIETSPNIAYVWGLFKENIPLARLLETGKILCYTAKWYGDDKEFFDSIYHSSSKQMFKGIHQLLDEADVVVHYNGTDFDIPNLNRGFIELKMSPPSPYKQVDLLKVVRKHFKFTSNKMQHVSEQLGTGSKREVDFGVWTGCMNNDKKSWETMREYNIEDVLILEKMYSRLLPWITNHPNTGLYQENGEVCPNCGSVHYVKRGFAYTTTGRYQRYHCKDCWSWFRSKNVVERGKTTFRGA
jgi:DNA polymerase elongation subunit (family B)